MSRVRFVAALAVTAALGACSPHTAAPVERAAPAAGERFQVHAAPTSDIKVVAATVQTRDEGEARARIGGTLTTLTVREGDVVRRGQLLGRVVDQRLNYETGAAGAQVAAADAEAVRAQAELARIAQLYDKGIYAKARLEQAQAQARAAQGALVAARAQHDASRELAGQGAILAPSDGRVLKADVPAGSVVAQGQSIATVTAGPPVLRLEIPEADARGLVVGQRVETVSEDLPNVSGGTISQIYPAVTAGRVAVDVTVPGLRADLVGQRVRVRIPVGRRLAVTVPSRFVSHRFGLDYVRVLDRNGGASEVAVQLAAAGAGQVEVLSGLTDGDVIVAPGAPS